jgi:16S rRNA U516 pseudouridylate synthase RsuA-like enzyme
MAKPKKKLTPAQKAHKRLMREKYQWIFVNGKQKRVRRAPTVEGLPVDEFIRRNADPIWLMQHEEYEELHAWQLQQDQLAGVAPAATDEEEDERLPF